MKRRYFWWGLCCALTVLSCFVIAIVVQIAFSFNGQCGGLIPFLAGPRPCSFWEYFSGQALFVLLVVRETYWPLYCFCWSSLSRSVICLIGCRTVPPNLRSGRSLRKPFFHTRGSSRLQRSCPSPV